MSNPDGPYPAMFSPSQVAAIKQQRQREAAREEFLRRWCHKLQLRWNNGDGDQLAKMAEQYDVRRAGLTKWDAPI